MKTQLLIPILSIAASMALHAQNPGGPPPPGANQQNERRERFKKMAERFREHRGERNEARPQERAEHIREALKHLRAAGLDRMADRIEEAVKQMREERGPSPSSQPPPPQDRAPLGGAQQFGRPAPPAPLNNQGARPNVDRHDDLQAQVQRLSRQVEELRNLIQNRAEKSQGQEGARAGEHRKHHKRERGPHHRNHESQPGNSGSEEIKPALRPQAGAAE